MTFERASTLAMRRFANDHVLVNKDLKVSTSALWHLEDIVAKSGIQSIANGFGSVKSWKTVPVSVFGSAERESLVYELGRMAVLRIVSSFDTFLTGITGDLDRAGVSRKKQEVCLVCGEKNTADDWEKSWTIEGFVNSYNIDNEVPSELVKVERMFNVVRNCCAHRAGDASKALVSLAQSDDIKKAIAAFPAKARPIVNEFIRLIHHGQRIPVHPRHAIFASDLYFKIAKLIDAAVIRRLGEKGILLSAVAHLGKLSRFEKAGHNSVTVEAAVSHALLFMRVTRPSLPSTVSALRRHELWDSAKEKFEEFRTRHGQHS